MEAVRKEADATEFAATAEGSLAGLPPAEGGRSAASAAEGLQVGMIPAVP